MCPFVVNNILLIFRQREMLCKTNMRELAEAEYN